MNRSTIAIAAVTLLIVAAAATSALLLNRAIEERALDRLWFQLEHPRGHVAFTADMVADLPEPAQRYFLHAIAPGTVLASSVVMRMHGTLQLQQDRDPLPMKAVQVLAPPRGFVWRADVGRGAMRIHGFDRYSGATGEMRWWLLGIVPVVSEAGADVARSAAGRLAGEGALVPSSLLPARGAVWHAVDDSTAAVTLDIDGELVSFTLVVAADGRLRRVTINRWNSDPANGAVGYVPFVVEFEDEQRTFGGYTIPARLQAGWARDGVFRPFFVAEFDDAVYH
jgi:hypothetical protein